jgi:exodeoxyribonuclease V gamma subunit
VPVAELLDVLDARFSHPSGSLGEVLTTRHALQPFSPKPFASSETAAPFAHDARQLRAAVAFRDGLRAPEPTPPFLTIPLPDPENLDDIDLDELCRFWADPIGRLMNTRLRLRRSDAAIEVPDREPATIDRGLGEWALRDRLLCRLLEGESLAIDGPEWRRLQRDAVLPLGVPGRRLYHELARQAEEIAAEALPARAVPRPHVDVDLVLDGRRIHGRVREMFDGGRVVCQAGKLQARQRFTHWILHLALGASGVRCTTRLFGRGSRASYAPIDPTEAREHLADLVHLYGVGQRVPLLFFPGTSEKLVHATGEYGVQDWFFNKGWQDWEPSAEAWRVLGGAFPFEPETPLPLPVPDGLDAVSLALRVWRPALHHPRADP